MANETNNFKKINQGTRVLETLPPDLANKFSVPTKILLVVGKSKKRAINNEVGEVK